MATERLSVAERVMTSTTRWIVSSFTDTMLTSGSLNLNKVWLRTTITNTRASTNVTVAAQQILNLRDLLEVGRCCCCCAFSSAALGEELMAILLKLSASPVVLLKWLVKKKNPALSPLAPHPPAPAQLASCNNSNGAAATAAATIEAWRAGKIDPALTQRFHYIPLAVTGLVDAYGQRSEPAHCSSAPSTGCILWLTSCGWTLTEFILSGFTLVNPFCEN